MKSLKWLLVLVIGMLASSQALAAAAVLSSFILQITATDNGTPSLFDTANVTIPFGKRNRFIRNKRNMKPSMGNSGSGAHNY